MITLYRRNRVFWARRCEFGKQLRQSLHTRDLQVARQLVRRMELDVLSSGRLRRVPWSEFEKEFIRWIEPQVRPKTLKGYRFTVKRFGRFIEGCCSGLVAETTPAAVSAYVEERSQDQHPSWKRGLSPGGIKFDLRILHRVFSYAVDCGYIEKNPVRVRKLNATAGRTMPFSSDEVASMLKDQHLQKTPQLRAIVLTFLHTGLRISDVIDLRKESVSGRPLVVKTQKRGKVVSLHLHPEVATAIRDHLAKLSDPRKKSQFLFSTEQGTRLNELDKHLRRLWRRCGVEKGHAHRFRDTFAVGLLARGASLYDVAKLLGVGVGTAERHYAPYVKELQKRGEKLIAKLRFTDLASRCA